MKDDRYYYGHTADLKTRLIEHNNRRVKSIKGRIPFVIHYFETFESRSDARRREAFFKSIEGYRFLKENNII